MNPYIIPSSYVVPDEDPSKTICDMKDLLFKILVVGNYGVGKTAIIRRYTADTFTQNYKITIGVDFALKTLKYNDDTLVTLQLWDIAGHERFGHMTGTYYRHSQAAIIVFDLTRIETLDCVIKWLNDIKEKAPTSYGKPMPIILLANKCDMHGVTIPCQLLSQYCKKNDILAWFFTSAKENINISDSIQYLVEKIYYLYENRSNFETIPNDSFRLTMKKEVKKKKIKCC